MLNFLRTTRPCLYRGAGLALFSVIPLLVSMPAAALDAGLRLGTELGGPQRYDSREVYLGGGLPFSPAVPVAGTSGVDLTVTPAVRSPAVPR